MKKRIAVIVTVGFAVVLGFTASLFAMNESVAENSVVIIYGSRYGSTAQTGKWIAEGMDGKADVISAADVGDLSGYKAVILGSGIYGGKLQEDMIAFLSEHKDAVKGKIAALYVVCGATPPGSDRYLTMFAEQCGADPELKQAFQGWMKQELFTPEDKKGMEEYAKRSGRPLEDYDRTDKDKCTEFGKKILESLGH